MTRSTNLYGYVAADPVNFVDPSGLYSETDLYAALTPRRPEARLLDLAGVVLPGVSAPMPEGLGKMFDAGRRTFRNVDRPSVGRRLSDETGSFDPSAFKPKIQRHAEAQVDS